MVDFGGGGLSASGVDIFVAKYDSAGAHFWSRRLDVGVFSSISDIAVDAAGDIYVTGGFADTLNVGGSVLMSAGNTDAFLLKLSGVTGSTLWAVRYGASGSESGRAVAASGGEVVWAARFAGGVDFGGGILTSLGMFDAVLAKYAAANGAHVWSKRLGPGASSASSRTLVDELLLDGVGNIYVAGSFAGSTDAGGGPLTSAGADDGLVAKFTPSGAHTWSRRFGASGQDVAASVALRPDGTVVVVGIFAGQVDFGSATLVSAGGSDAFVAVYSAANSPLAATRYGGSGDDGAAAVGWVGDQVIVTGYFAGAVDFGFGAFAAQGPSDLFVLGL
jgi:hypothetical protein